jgi:drug/metabolite transporter (DMT)-like permease
MTAVALALVLGAAACHATWNLLLKRSGGGSGLPFLWLALAGSLVIYAPAAAVAAAVERPEIGGVELVFIAGTAVLHLGYFVLLQRGYRAGDLSLVYPLARGTGPALATAAAIVILGERPSALAFAGTLLVIAGLIALAHPRALLQSGRWAGPAVAYALATGGFIATYTLWDAHAVSALAIPPLVYDWCGNAGRVLLLAPVVLRRPAELRATFAAYRGAILGVAVLSPLAYILVLTALVTTPVSYVAPAREASIVLGAVLGTWLLGEGDARRRIGCAVAITAGIAALALG